MSPDVLPIELSLDDHHRYCVQYALKQNDQHQNNSNNCNVPVNMLVSRVRFVYHRIVNFSIYYGGQNHTNSNPKPARRFLLATAQCTHTHVLLGIWDYRRCGCTYVPVSRGKGLWYLNTSTCSVLATRRGNMRTDTYAILFGRWLFEVHAQRRHVSLD